MCRATARPAVLWPHRIRRPTCGERTQHCVHGSPAMNSTHVVPGSGGQAVRAALAAVASADDVLQFADPLHQGPLADINDAGIARRAFWEEVYPREWVAEVSVRESAALKALRAARSSVVVWRGAHPGDHLLALRVAALLRGRDVDLFEILVPRTNRSLPAFYSTVSMVTPEEAVALLDTRIPVRDALARAARWDRLSSNASSGFRRLSRGRVIELGPDTYDQRILAACSSAWKPTLHVLVEVFSKVPVGDQALAWRVRSLVNRGMLEERGLLQSRNWPAELRLVS